MDLSVAAGFSVLVMAASAGVGVYLRRYHSLVTEMLGMMMGMTFGMMTGITVGFFIGVATDMFISNLVAVIVGVVFGVVFGRVGGLMGMMDGGMGGMMGGMMGAMLGVMVNLSPLAVWVTAALMAALFALSLIALVRLVQTSTARQYALDPVCGMAVDTATTKLTSQYNGNTIYFCAPGCKRAFDQAPEKFVAIKV
jgi:YHS domain-containing protein